MMDNPQRKTGWFKLFMGANALTAVVLAAVLVLFINYLSARHYTRFDWSQSHFYALSDKTLSLLASVTNRVEVKVLFQPGHELYADMDYLLQEYKVASPYIQVEMVDPDRDMARTEELAAKYGLTAANVVVFDCGGRIRMIGRDDLAEYDYAPLQVGQPPVMTAFRGEQAFSSAIQSVVQAHRPVVYFLQGHGERDPESFDTASGYSKIALAIHRDMIDIRKLTLGERSGIPDDCDVLIVAGAEKPFSKPELNLIAGYLQKKGRVMVLADALVDSGMEELLEDWGISLGRNVVVDGTRTLSGRELFITQYGTHPVTHALKKLTTVFYLPRSVMPLITTGEEAADDVDKPKADPLALCSEDGWAETDLEQNPMKFDAGVDEPGPVAVAAAVEKGTVPGFDVQIRPARLVVFGDSDFVSNGGLVGANADFFMNALNWLVERSELLAIAPKPIEETRLMLSESQLSLLFWTVVLIIPGAVAIVGLLVWLRRRV